MRRFTCERCGTAIAFDAERCGTCSAHLGYVPEQLTLRALRATPPPGVLEVEGSDQPVWRCLNAAWGCNWVLPAGGSTVWCRSCRLTRGRPADSDPAGLAAWASVESTKRRLVHQLDSLGLTYVERTPTTPHGLAFDLVHLPGQAEVSGYFDGVISVDLTEAREERRDALRRQFSEPLRTVIGHLRHEIGHYCWGRLVPADDPTTSAAFEGLFGDGHADYKQAIAAYYRPGRPPWDPTHHITPYAAAHPLEDWADTFAHYLHITDALETAEAAGLVEGTRHEPAPSSGSSFDDVLDRWTPLAQGLNAVAASLGSPDVYPLSPRGLVVEKLAFVHERVRAESVLR